MQSAGSESLSPLSIDAEGREATIYVCNLKELPGHAETLRPSRLISLVPGYEQPETPVHLKAPQHLRLELDDIAAPLADLILPEVSHVRRLVDFIAGWEGDAPLLIHCAAGISRSTAAALVALCCHSDAEERELAVALRRAAPHASPNKLIVRLADEILQRNGRLIDAVAALPPAAVVAEGPLTRLPVKLQRALKANRPG